LESPLNKIKKYKFQEIFFENRKLELPYYYFGIKKLVNII